MTGDTAPVPRPIRDASTIAWLETLLQDIRYGLRQLAKAPALVTVAVVSLALGIGANTAIFTLINAVMLQSLPVRDPARLVLFYDGISTGVYDGDRVQSDEFSYPFWEYLQTHHDPFESLAAFRQSNDPVILHVAGSSDSGPSERATVHMVAGNYFDVLGVGAAAGRVLTPADDSLTAPPAAVVSYPFWRDRFDLDPATVGREVVLNGTAFTIVGVANREFFGERIQSAPDFWLPLSAQPGILQKESWRSAADVFWLNFLGRRKPDVTLAQAQAAMNLRFQQFYLAQPGLSAEQRHRIETTHIELKPGGGGISGLRYLYSKPLHILMAVVAVVLLIACANIATLLLARALPRRQEFLVRLALGASRGRLLRQVLTESVLLSAIGGLAGAGFAWWSVKLLVALLGVNPVVRVSPDPIVLGFTLALSLLTGIFFGIFPALKFSRLEHRPVDIPRSAPGRRFGAAQALIAMQVALSVILLFGAGLLAHSLLALQGQDLGFRRDNILVIGTDASLAGYEKSELLPLYRDIADRLSTLPGVVSASICRFTPVSGSSSSGNFSLQGHTPTPGERLDVYYLPVAPGFFETLGIPLMLGRTIGSTTRRPARP
jgi:predicted permease